MESDDDFQIFSSQEEKKSYLVVPEDTLFKIKISESNKVKKVGYRLKKGVDLPCEKLVDGFNLRFSIYMEVFMDGFTCEAKGDKKQNVWCFRKISSSIFNDSLSREQLAGTDIGDETCSILGESMEASFESNEVLLPSYSGVSQPNPISTPTTSETTITVENISTPHTNAEWLQNLKDNFRSLIVDQCSRKVKDAVAGNVNFEVAAVKREVRLALIHATIDHIHGVFGGVGRPKLKDMKVIANELAFHYPAMFKFDTAAKGYGLGGKKGVDGLANQLLDYYRAREGPRNKKSSEEVDPVKRGKRKYQYGIFILILWSHIIFFAGVDNDKWYKIVKIGQVEPKLRKMGDIGYEQREKVFEEHREEVMCHIRLDRKITVNLKLFVSRDSKKQIRFVVRGFFEDSRHVENMFKYLTKTSLVRVVEDNFVQQIGLSFLV